MARNFSGEWVLERQENFERLAKQHGVDLDEKRMIIEQGDDKVKITWGNGVRTFEFNVPGETIMKAGPMEAKWIARWEGKKLVVTVERSGPAGEGVEPGIITREIVDGKLNVTHEFGGHTATRVFNRA